MTQASFKLPEMAIAKKSLIRYIFDLTTHCEVGLALNCFYFELNILQNGFLGITFTVPKRNVRFGLNLLPRAFPTE